MLDTVENRTRLPMANLASLTVHRSMREASMEMEFTAINEGCVCTCEDFMEGVGCVGPLKTGHAFLRQTLHRLSVGQTLQRLSVHRTNA